MGSFGFVGASARLTAASTRSGCVAPRHGFAESKRAVDIYLRNSFAPAASGVTQAATEQHATAFEPAPPRTSPKSGKLTEPDHIS
jgi:hypothetical protein